jgi:zinc protease
MRLPVVLLACLSLPAFAALPAKPGPAFPCPLKVSRLPNGLTVVRVPFPSRGLVAFDTVVRVGSRNEQEPGHTGFAHFFEHMMFRGTKRFPASARSDRLAGLGFLDNAFTTDDITLFYVYGPSSALEEVVTLEADRFQHLAYDLAAFQTEARAVLGEYHKSAASPELKLSEALLGTAFQRHPYRHTTLGFYEDIQKMPERYAYSLEFLKRWYAPDNLLIVVAGEFDDARLMAWIEREYGGWTGKAASADVTPEPSQTQARSVTVDWESPTLPRAVDAWHVPAARLDSPDGALAQILGAYLAGPISPLYVEAVLEKQWASSLIADAEVHRDPPLLFVEGVLKREEDRAPFEAALDAEVNALLQGNVDATRLKEIQSALRYGLLMGLDTAESVAERVAYYAGVYGAPDGLERHMRWLASVTPRQLSRFAQQTLVPTNRTQATLHGPSKRTGAKQ